MAGRKCIKISCLKKNNGYCSIGGFLMISLGEEISKAIKVGYSEANAAAKVCQDVILDAISRRQFNRNITIKGGVVMRSITNNIRRATQDMDIDFIRFSLADDSIKRFVEKLNTIDGIMITLKGRLEELKQQDYHGKRAYINIEDSFGFQISSKVDFGVHKHMEIKQEEFCFDVALQEDGVSLLINSKEQMFTEKLRSILKFGTVSTRYKDIFDIFWLSQSINRESLQKCLETFIFSDDGMRENTMDDLRKRIGNVLSNPEYRKKLAASKKNWLDKSDDEACDGIINFLNQL